MFSARFFSVSSLEKAGVYINFAPADQAAPASNHKVRFQWIESEDSESVIQRFDAYVQQTVQNEPALQGPVTCSVKTERLSSNPESPDHEILMQIINILHRYGLDELTCPDSGSFLASAHGIDAMSRLGRLNISQCNLAELPLALFTLTSLRALNASSNKFTVLPPAVSLLTALQELRADGNALTSLPGACLLTTPNAV
jgi:Leucine-rich repeat (LRR) protein